MDKTKVVFRIWSNGEVIALFPQIPADLYGYACMSYEHVGQHGDANLWTVVKQTRQAKEAEYAELKRELELQGYALEVRKRCTEADRRMRIAKAKEDHDALQ